MKQTIRKNQQTLGILVGTFAVLVFLLALPSFADAKVTVVGDRAFADDINNCFNTYRNVEGVVGEVIRELENSEHEHQILNSPKWNNTSNDLEAATGGSGSGTVTRVNRAELEKIVKEVESLKHKDFCTALLHELWHAVDADRGTRTPHSDKVDGVKRNELEATAFQNLIHAIRGVPPRTTYGGVDLSKHLVLTDAEEEGFVEVSVLILGGKQYPIEQFIAAPSDACDADHYHSASHGPVYSLEGGSITDPNPPACGFGKVRDVQDKNVFVKQSILDAYNSQRSKGAPEVTAPQSAGRIEVTGLEGLKTR